MGKAILAYRGSSAHVIQSRLGRSNINCHFFYNRHGRSMFISSLFVLFLTFLFPNTFTMSEEACCTCAALLSSIPPTYDEKTEKPTLHERRLECCNRAICARCTTDNPRFQNYCPFCQVSVKPSPLGPQGLRDPPAYSPPPDSKVWAEKPAADDGLPAYSARPAVAAGSGQDVVHFVDPRNDSIHTLSIRYGVPPNALKRANGLFSDHLIAARRTIIIPGEYYKGGVSLSPRPLEGEEEEARKGKVRKWMVACKAAEYVSILAHSISEEKRLIRTEHYSFIQI